MQVLTGRKGDTTHRAFTTVLLRQGLHRCMLAMPPILLSAALL